MYHISCLLLVLNKLYSPDMKDYLFVICFQIASSFQTQMQWMKYVNKNSELKELLLFTTVEISCTELTVNEGSCFLVIAFKWFVLMKNVCGNFLHISAGTQEYCQNIWEEPSHTEERETTEKCKCAKKTKKRSMISVFLLILQDTFFTSL